MAVLGRLSGEAAAWAQAWRARHDNALSRQAALDGARARERRPAWLPCSRFMFAASLLVSLGTAALLVLAWLRFNGVANSPVITTAFARNALYFGLLQVLEGAVLLCLLWLAERLALSFWFAGGLLRSYAARSEGLGQALAGSTLSDHDYVVGTLSHVTRLCWLPLLALSGLGTLSAFIYESDLLSTQFSLEHNAWAPGQLPWLALLALLTALLKPLCGLLAICATALTLLTFSPWWRSSVVASVVAGLALLWHLPGLALALPGLAGQQLNMWLGDAFAQVYGAPWVALPVTVLLFLLAIEAHTTSALRAHEHWARQGMPALRPLLVTGAVALLLFAGGNLLAFLLDVVGPDSSGDQRLLAPLLLWPLLAASAVPPQSLLALVSNGAGLAWSGAFAQLGLLGLAQGGLPLLLVLIFAGQARAAVYLRRSVLG